MKTTLLLLSLVVLGGCTASMYASSLVNRYCGLPEASRKANREAVALAVAPARVEVQCPGDADEIPED